MPVLLNAISCLWQTRPLTHPVAACLVVCTIRPLQDSGLPKWWLPDLVYASRCLYRSRQQTHPVAAWLPRLASAVPRSRSLTPSLSIWGPLSYVLSAAPGLLCIRYVRYRHTETSSYRTVSMALLKISIDVCRKLIYLMHSAYNQ